VIVKTGNINFEKFPVAPLQFDILKIESRKKEKLLNRARLEGVPFVFGERSRGPRESGVGMSEKKTVSEAEESKATAKKSAKKKTAAKPKKENNAADVRKRVSKMVKAKAMNMAKAVIGETKKGVPQDLQLATVKYLFEVAEIYPPQADQDAATADEDCLAKTLLNRLNIPDVPIRRDEDVDVVSPEKSSVGESEGKDSGVKENEEGDEPGQG